ncbi:MAG: DMT family transporter [Paracoccaceae bacterium]
MTAAPGGRAWALALLLGLIWGSSFMLTNMAVRDLPPLSLAALRLCFAALLLLGAAAAMGARLPGVDAKGRRLWVFAAGSGVFGTILPFWLISWAQIHVPSAMTGVLMAPMPLLSLVLSHFLITGQRMNALRIAGLLFGLLGVFLLIGPDAVGGADGHADGGVDGGGLMLLGQLASLGAMTCYALNGIAMMRAGPVDPLGMSAAVVGVAAIVALPLALWLEAPDLGAISLRTWALVGALGLGATALAQILIFAILALSSPPFLAAVNYQVPLWATVFGLVFLDEALRPMFWPALALILAGLALAQIGGRAR